MFAFSNHWIWLYFSVPAALEQSRWRGGGDKFLTDQWRWRNWVLRKALTFLIVDPRLIWFYWGQAQNFHFMTWFVLPLSDRMCLKCTAFLSWSPSLKQCCLNCEQNIVNNNANSCIFEIFDVVSECALFISHDKNYEGAFSEYNELPYLWKTYEHELNHAVILGLDSQCPQRGV